MNSASIALVAAGLLVVVLVMWLLRKTALLKDQLIPQIAATERTYSLAKTQMAFWTLIILESFLYAVLYKKANLSDPIIVQQTLTLMGISLLTAGGAAVVEARQDSPEDRLNDALRAVGINSYVDVRRLEDSAKNSPDLSVRTSAQTSLSFYRASVSDFRTEGFWTDLVCNVNGTGLHRLQAVVWTIVVGVLFVWEMVASGSSQLPALDGNLLTVMGISNAGYVGFKINEQNN